jgi:putative glutamine amidotransferase
MEYENRVWVLGVQWHPEWKFDSNPISRKIFHEFGEQVRRFVSLRE